ncbi:hypothetical protein ACFLZY_01455 [Patescibacteria group bacterium]
MKETYSGSTCKICSTPSEVGCDCVKQESNEKGTEQNTYSFKVDKGSGASIDVEVPGIPEELEVLGQKWIKKPEFHITLIGFATKLDKLIKTAAATRGEKVSNKEVKNMIKDVLEKLSETSRFEVKMSNELRKAERDEDRTLIQMGEVEGVDEFLRSIEAEFQLEPESLKSPPVHITLYTGENGNGIGISTQEKLEELTVPIEVEIQGL